MATPDTETREIHELLPWYLNGSLDDAEAERVRRHLERHSELQAEAEATDAVLQAIAEDVVVPMLTHERIDRVMVRLDGEPRQSDRLTSSVDGIRRWWRDLAFEPGHRLPAAVAAAFVLVAVLVVIPQPTTDDGDFRTLSADRPPVSVQVEMIGDVSNTDVQALFDEHSLNAERQATGVYVITLPGDTSVSELYGILQTLRADGRVADARALTDED